MRIPRAANPEDGGMGLTPLIDVVFLLLIFFIVATSFDEPRLALDLPSAESAEAAEPQDTLRVEIRNSGEVFVDGELERLDDIGAIFAERADSIEGVELRAELEVPHGTVVEVLDRARVHGLNQISIAVESRDGARAPSSMP